MTDHVRPHAIPYALSILFAGHRAPVRHGPRSERVAIATHVFLPVGHVGPLQLEIDERRVQEAVQRLPYRLDTVQHVVALSGLGDRGQPYRLVELITDYGLISGLGP